jgi:hypothetical protein
MKTMTLITLVLVLARAQPPEKRPTVIMKLTCENQVVQPGGQIKLRLDVSNPGRRAIEIDNGSLTSFAVVRGADGGEIPQWPFMDELLVAPGKEAVWRLPAGGHQMIDGPLEFRAGTWSGFGIPDRQYQGYAIEVAYDAGKAIHAIGKLPTTVTIVWRWIADPETVKSRAHQLGLAPGWSGDVISNPVEIRLAAPAPSSQ